MDAILTMHSVDDSGSLLSISAPALARLLDALLDDGVEFTSIDGILRPTRNQTHRVVLTFDDGLASTHEAALPLLEKRRIPATVYVVSAWVGRDNRWASQPGGAPSFALMAWPQIEELRDAGWDIGSHGANHTPMQDLSDAAWEEELRGSRRRLEDRLQVPVRHLAYPYGIASAEAERRASLEYASGVSTNMNYLVPSANRHRLPRIDTYYLRNGGGARPVFGVRSLAYLKARALLRRIRQGGRA